jgi:hypothetical protein
MGAILRHPPVKFLCGALCGEEPVYADALAAMIERFGAVDFESDPMLFIHTDYYRVEMGDGLLRRFVAFATLREPDELVAGKHATNALEDRFRRPDGTRRINLDIGYLAPAKLVLATTKDHGHRIYLGGGIFAELEYWYQFGDFTALPWTFPDYRTDTYRSIFRRIRERYLVQLADAGIPARCRPLEMRDHLA